MDEGEIDMFADLEQTLCEGLTNLNFNRTNTVVRHGIDVSCLEQTSNLSKINGPAVRAYNLYKATMAFKGKQYLDSVYFESFALSLPMRIKFHANKIMEAEHHMPTEDNLANLLEEKHRDRPEMFDYIDRFLKDAPMDEPTIHRKSIEFENGTDLMKLCHELPDEWTIIQLCKQVNTEVYMQTRSETLQHESLIFLTLIRYPMSERFNHQPIKIDLNQTDLKQLYATSYEIFTKFESTSYDYLSKIQDSEFDGMIVSKFKKLLGPWIVCFSGKSRSTRADSEAIDKVDLFLEKCGHKFSQRQNVLICLFALRVYMLTKDDIKEAALYISKTKFEYWDLMDFFEDLKLVSKVRQKANDCFPVILVIDEHIDFMYWEMCNPEQEFTRVDSILTLLKLYFHHQDNITQGYFNVKGQKGSAVINPDRTLPQFTNEVYPFVKELPNTTWKFVIDVEPTFKDLRPMLADSNVYVYCGHGSGLQFISSYETCQLTTNAVVFLMGCSSVAFRADHGYSFGTAAHHYYHIAKSPAVIGHLNLTYTSFGGTFINVMLAKWFSNVTKFDTKIFADSQAHFAKKMKENLDGSTAIDKSPYLSKIISQFRHRGRIPIAFRAILCHRGLPVRISDSMS